MPRYDFNCPITQNIAVPAHPELGTPPKILYSFSFFWKDQFGCSNDFFLLL